MSTPKGTKIEAHTGAELLESLNIMYIIILRKTMLDAAYKHSITCLR